MTLLPQTVEWDREQEREAAEKAGHNALDGSAV